jgi:xanthine dehydrogenase YagS FAD-binding subunit
VKSFAYVRPADIASAVAAIREPDTKFPGGGTNLVDLMHQDLEHPARLVDLTALPLTDLVAIPDGGLRIGASGQIRHMATVGGNLLQRTRCHYF